MPPSLHRGELSAEAIRLARMVHRLLPGDCEAAGLLALMLLTDARRPARAGPDGGLVPMAEQDGSLWDAGRIAEGVALITEALPRGHDLWPVGSPRRSAPRRGLDLLGKLEADERIADDHRLHAVRGHLLEMAGDRAGARDAYEAAARRTTNLPQRRYLHTRAARLTDDQ